MGESASNGFSGKQWNPGFMKCEPVFTSGSVCRKSSDVPQGYHDYTDAVSWPFCGDGTWQKVIMEYGATVLTNKGHSAEFSLVGREDNWDYRNGSYMVIKAHGTSAGSDVQCEMEAGIKLFMCNQAASNWTCTCEHNGENSLIILDQAARITTPEDATKAKTSCGRWFLAASTV